jgi:spore germination protein
VKKTLLTFVFLLAIAPASFAHRIAAWIPPWNLAALDSIRMNANAVSESNPVWYSWNADGTIAKNWNAENNNWRAAMSGTLLIPTIQNVVGGSYDQAGVEKMLATAASREGHANAIAQLVQTQAFDGIDIDYERIPTSSRANFTAFISTLAQKLRAANKKLSVTVYAKTSDSQNWTGPGAADWPALGGLADSVKIMAYDYSWATSAPGPISPLDWLDKVATYAQSVIPNEKIMIGLPFYGYSWANGTGRGVSYNEAMQMAANQGATIQRDANGEATFTFGAATVFFQDATSYQRKVEMLKQKHPQIGGFAHWSLGQEDPAIWNVIRGGSSTSPATPPPNVTPPPTPAPTPNPTPAPTPNPTPAPTQPAKRRAAGH